MSPSDIKVIVFDLGGVVLDWNPRHLYRHYFDSPEQIERFLSEIGFAAWNTQQDMGRPFAEGVALLSAQYPQYASLIHAYHQHWEQSVSGPIDGTVEIVRALKSRGYPVHALSNWSAETFPTARAKYDCLELFDGILISGDVRVAKPDPRIFEILLERLGHPAQACLLIDDNEPNVAVAARLGFQTVRFESPEQLRSRLHDLRLL